MEEEGNVIYTQPEGEQGAARAGGRPRMVKEWSTESLEIKSPFTSITASNLRELQCITLNVS